MNTQLITIAIVTVVALWAWRKITRLLRGLGSIIVLAAVALGGYYLWTHRGVLSAAGAAKITMPTASMPNVPWWVRAVIIGVIVRALAGRVHARRKDPHATPRNPAHANAQNHHHPAEQT